MRLAIVFRVDASQLIGTGHVMRCLALADALRERGAKCLFIHRAFDGNMAETIRERGHTVRALPAPTIETEPGDKLDYNDWLGVPVEQDALQTLEALGAERPDWLVVDHYALDATWEAELRPAVGAIAVLDDLANRPHDCDLLLDQNYFGEPANRYSELVPQSTTRLCGPRYALLRPEYAQARQLIGPRRGPISRVLIFYGGADPDNETGRALRVLSRPEFAHLAADVVIGANHPYKDTLHQQAQERPRTSIHGQREHLVDLQIEADLALSSGGTTTWERCALGLPAIVTALAENQEPFNQSLADDSVVTYLGPGRTLGDEGLARALQTAIDNPEALAVQAARAWRVTDGLGAGRMAEAMIPTPRENLTLRKARRADKALYFEWVNEPETRRQAHNSDPISWSVHDAWFDQRLADPSTHLWILETPANLPAGQVRVEPGGDDPVLSYSIDPAFRSRGWGTQALHLAIKEWRAAIGTEATFLIAETLDGNEASRRALLRAGFQEDSRIDGGGAPLSLTILSDCGSWINDWIPGILTGWMKQGHRVRWVHKPAALKPGDLCFFLGCGQLVSPEQLTMHSHNMVVHASDLPRGRGWSPLTWQVLEGRRRVPVTLLEAVASVDAGDIYLQQWIDLAGHELLGEIREEIALATQALCRAFVNKYPDVVEQARPQSGEPSYYPRRGPADSMLNPNQSLADQFELLRVVDNDRYPAFFELRGQQYRLRIQKVTNE